MSAGDRPKTDRVAKAKQSVAGLKDAIRLIVAKPWGPIPRNTRGRQLEAEHARLVASLARAEAELAEAKAALGR